MKKLILLLAIIGLQVYLPARAQSYLGEYQIQARCTLANEDDYEESHSYVIDIKPCNEQGFDFQFYLDKHSIYDDVKGRIKLDDQFVLPSQQFTPEHDTTYITYFSGNGNFKGDSIFIQYYMHNPHVYGALACDCKGVRLDAQEPAPSPWFPDGAEWYYGIFDNFDLRGGTGCIHMTVAKDTLFAGRPCKQLKLEACDGKFETLYEYVYPCGDSLFYYNYAAQDFFLLLDLSAKKGDTVWVHDSVFFPNPGFDPYRQWNYRQNDFMAYKIIGIDTIVRSGKSLRRQQVKPITERNVDGQIEFSYWRFPSWKNGDYYVVEGIGSFGGFWGESYPGHLEWGYCKLRCFFAEGKTYMTDGKCDNAAVETPLENPAAFWRLSPQPATESVQAVCEAAETGWHSGNWRLVDAGGKALRRGTFRDGRFDVSLSAIPTGLYFIEVTANGTTCRLKCVKR